MRFFEVRVTVLALRGSAPNKALRRLYFPDPFGPLKVTISYGAMLKSTLCKTRLRPRVADIPLAVNNAVMGRRLGRRAQARGLSRGAADQEGGGVVLVGVGDQGVEPFNLVRKSICGQKVERPVGHRACTQV